MPDFVNLPSIKASMFKFNQPYTIEIERIKQLEGRVLMDLAVNPEVLSNKEKAMISRGTMWFTEPAHQKFESEMYEWSLYPLLSAFVEGSVFTLVYTAGREWKVVSDGEIQLQPPPEGPIAPPAAPTPQPVPKALPQRPTASLGDMVDLLHDCRMGVINKVLGWDGTMDADKEEVVQDYAATLFIHATRQGLDQAYRIKRDLENAGPKPEAEDDLPL